MHTLQTALAPSVSSKVEGEVVAVHVGGVDNVYFARFQEAVAVSFSISLIYLKVQK